MNQEEREILRKSVVGYLAVRQGLKFAASSIRRSIASRGLVDFTIFDADVEQALQFAKGFGWVAESNSDVGASVYWESTSAGVLEAERKGWCA